MIQLAIEKAELGDYSEVKKLYEYSLNPYTNNSNIETCKPKWADDICITCSS